MRLTKMKAATAIAVALGLIGTGAGVVAQGPFPPRKMTDNERFQQVEQKLDRLLQALVGQRPPTPEGHRPPTPAPRAEPKKAIMRTQMGAFGLAPAGDPSQPPMRVELRQLPSTDAHLLPPMAATPALPEANPADRLNRLERRLDDIEKRLTRLEQKPNPTILESIPTESAPQADRFFRTRGGIGSDPQTSPTKR